MQKRKFGDDGLEVSKVGMGYMSLNFGTAVLLEEVGKVVKPGGVGVTISSQSDFHQRHGFSCRLRRQRSVILWPLTPEE